MKGHMNSEYGTIVIDPDVIATYVGSVAVESAGIVGMAAYNMKDGLVHLLRKDSLGRGINVKIEDNKISLVLHCIAAYGVSIPAITNNMIDNIKYKVEELTGMTVEHIDILIEGIRVID
ncbi:MAG TPA: Asp23/Gls24 family envelope stress response protein [Lachnospiraceae bacterium]|jgi:uncharacterized alkaline shock family protein YloU|nr:Asp23/Gls24 family envelope stress response protein [Lachnospiraceae bacterium]